MTEFQARPGAVHAAHSRTVQWADPREILRLAVERRLSGLDFLRAMRDGEIPAPPVGALLGFEIDEVEEGRVVFGLQPGEHHYNPNGVVHGGVAAMLLDTVTGCAVMTKLPFGMTCATLELKVMLPDGRLAAHATSTLMIFPPEEVHRGDRPDGGG
jgi:uncharacterized protein (TIGR00369 family)